MNLFRGLLDLVFPPLCLCCKERTRIPYFCEPCWVASALLDPMGRCMHCFSSIQEPQGICSTCASKPRWPFPASALFDREAPIRELLFREEMREAMGALAFYQSLRLGWTLPDLVVPVVSGKSSMASLFAAFHECPCPHLFRRGEIREELIEEEQVIWLFDEGASPKQLDEAAKAIGNAFPKKVYLLSLLA